MMEDNSVAKLLVSSIIGEEIISLEPKPQERTKEKASKEDHLPDSITVYHLDFSAKIKTSEGHRIVLIEMQKASYPSDIMRFRGYIGQQYIDESNKVKGKNDEDEPMQIYSIYFLGDDLKICDTPVLSVFPEVRDVATKKVVEAKSKFIESLNHKCWIVQISCLKKRRRNELEILLSAFDQNNRDENSKHILNVNDEEIPEKYRPLFRRLKMAASSKEVKDQMKKEDGVLNYIKNWARVEANKAIKEKDEEMAKALEESQKENVQIIKALAEKDKALEESNKENEVLRQELERLKKEKSTKI
jgi:hypothetical protein